MFPLVFMILPFIPVKADFSHEGMVAQQMKMAILRTISQYGLQTPNAVFSGADASAGTHSCASMLNVQRPDVAKRTLPVGVEKVIPLVRSIILK